MDTFALPDFFSKSSTTTSMEEMNNMFTTLGKSISKDMGKNIEIVQTLQNALFSLVPTMSAIKTNTDDAAVRDKKNQDSKSEKDKKKKADTLWQKALKSKFFDKTMGFLKRMASMSFISQIVMLFVLLKTGILGAFLPWALSMVGSVISSIIKAIPAILKFAWKLIWETIPSILKNIFNAILDVLGVGKNSALRDVAAAIAKFLPLLILVVWAISTILPIIKSFSIVMTVVKGLMIAIAFIAKVVTGTLSIAATATLVMVGIVILIIAVVVLLGVLIWKFRKQIMNFLKPIFTAIKPILDVLFTVFKFIGLVIMIAIISAVKIIWEGLKFIGGLLFTVFSVIWNFIAGIAPTVWKSIVKVVKALIKFVKNIFDIIAKPFIAIGEAIGKFIAPILEKLEPVFRVIGEFVSKIGSFIGRIVDTIRDAFGGLVMWINNVLNYGLTWGTMSKEDKERIVENQKKLSTSRLGQALQENDRSILKTAEEKNAYDKATRWAASDANKMGLNAFQAAAQMMGGEIVEKGTFGSYTNIGRERISRGALVPASTVEGVGADK